MLEGGKEGPWIGEGGKGEDYQENDDDDARSQQSQDVEDLFEFDHELPVGFGHFVPEIVFHGVDGFARDPRNELILRLKMTAHHLRRLARDGFDLDAHLGGGKRCYVMMTELRIMNVDCR